MPENVPLQNKVWVLHNYAYETQSEENDQIEIYVTLGLARVAMHKHFDMFDNGEKKIEEDDMACSVDTGKWYYSWQIEPFNIKIKVD